MLRQDGIEDSSPLPCQNFLSCEAVNRKRYADNGINHRPCNIPNYIDCATHNQGNLISQEREHIFQNVCPVQRLQVEAFPDPFIQFGMIFHQRRQLNRCRLCKGRNFLR